MKILPEDLRCSMRTGRPTDRHDDLNSRFS